MVWYHLQRKMATHSTKGRTSTSVVVTTGMHPAARESYIRRLEAVSPPGAEAKPANDQNETTEDRPRHGSKSFMFVRGLRTGSAYLFCAFASKKRATRITHPSYFQLLHCTTFWTRIFFCFFSSIRRGIYQGCTLPRFKAVTYR